MNDESIVRFLSKSLGEEFSDDINKLVGNIFEDKQLTVGMRDDNGLVVSNIKFNSLYVFNDENTVEGDVYKPEFFFTNDDDFYFASEEIIRFNTTDTHFGILGKKWMKNKFENEFVEAIVFGNHEISSIDCMLGSVKVNGSFGESRYLAPGTLVSLREVEFKNTQYLEVSAYMAKFFLDNSSSNVWELVGPLRGYFWSNNGYYEDEYYFDYR